MDFMFSLLVEIVPSVNPTWLRVVVCSAVLLPNMVRFNQVEGIYASCIAYCERAIFDLVDYWTPKAFPHR